MIPSARPTPVRPRTYLTWKRTAVQQAIQHGDSVLKMRLRSRESVMNSDARLVDILNQMIDRDGGCLSRNASGLLLGRRVATLRDLANGGLRQ